MLKKQNKTFQGQVLFQTIQRPLTTGVGGRWLLSTQFVISFFNGDESSNTSASVPRCLFMVTVELKSSLLTLPRDHNNPPSAPFAVLPLLVSI